MEYGCHDLANVLHGPTGLATHRALRQGRGCEGTWYPDGAMETGRNAVQVTGAPTGKREPQADGREPMAAVLEAALPAGARVVACWCDAHGGLAGSASPDADPDLLAWAERLLDAGAPANDDPRRIDLAWHADGVRAAVAATLPAAMVDTARAAWAVLARRTIASHVALEHARARIETLESSERLQQALFEIADLSGSTLDLAEMLRRVHAVVGRLMYAENFYIVLYDDERGTVRFLYFADRRDDFVADPSRELSANDLPNSLTLALLRHGEPMQGASRDVRAALAVQADHEHGPDSEDWLGVPMLREGRVAGAIVVQSYDQPEIFGVRERALLSFVAQHIMTALDRHQARGELERRVEARTRELRRSNRELQGEILERQRSERLQRALFRITELSSTSGTLERFYEHVHEIVGDLLYARNFYIALVDEHDDCLDFPYSIDERDASRARRRLGSGLTEYVIASGRALLADRARIDELEERGVVRSHGSHAHCWLGVPLMREDAVVGVIAVQSYSPLIMFTERDQDLLTFVAHHIGSGLARKQATERLRIAHAELEQRVDARTRELAQANAELLEQINERVRAEERLTHQAQHDTLTGLPNRHQLLERLAVAIERSHSHPRRLFAVLFLDLDRFKLVNDSVGHSAGDELLVESGRRIVAATRGRDTVARLGGDEFAILVEDIESVQRAEELAQRIITALAQPVWVAGRELFPSASCGIATWSARYRDGAEMLRDADAAMYRAKAAGRNRCAVFDEAMREHAMQILDLEADLRRAINMDAFSTFYQPIVRLEDGALIGHEALLRWQHERRGLLVPAQFIGLGEDAGLIEEVDWLLYRQVAQQLARGGSGYISVNVSPRHFRVNDFAERLLRLLDAAGADPSRLRIEITEVALLDDVPRATRTLQVLREAGVLAQLDDFGTGYSALSYLHRFPIECLKIDQGFVAGMCGASRAESLAVVRAIQALASSFGIQTIGEGIETEEQRRMLCELGCNYGQGYLLGRPAQALFERAVVASLA